MPEYQIKSLSSDADIRSIIEAAGGDPEQNRFEDGVWYVDAPSQRVLNAAVKKYDHEAFLLPHVRASRLAQLAELRWRAETAGIMALGLAISTSRESQAMVHSAQLAAQKLKAKDKLNFKAQDGWKQVTAAEMDTIWQAVTDHVQSCFSQECALAAKIMAAKTVADLEAIELEF